MYQCMRCQTRYDLSKEHYKFLDEQIETNSVVETIIKCPGCNIKRIVGGEQDYDEIDDKNIIMMFGRDLSDSDAKKQLREFEGKKNI